MIKKIQYEDETLKICAPDSLTFLVQPTVTMFKENYGRILKFFHLENYPQYQINWFDEQTKFREYIRAIRKDDSLPTYAVGTYDLDMCNQYVYIDKDEQGIYKTINNEKKYLSKTAYHNFLCNPLHEFCHILYKNLAIPNHYEKRVVWLDEGLAQVLSGETEYLNDKEELKEFYEKVKAKTKEIPPLQGLKHGSAFVNENYNMYDLSFLAIRYLFDTKSEEEIYHIVIDTEKSNELGKTIMACMFKYYDKILYNEKWVK